MANSFDFAGYQGVVSEGWLRQKFKGEVFFSLRPRRHPPTPGPDLCCVWSRLLCHLFIRFTIPGFFFYSLDLNARPEPSFIFAILFSTPHASHTSDHTHKDTHAQCGLHSHFHSPFSPSSLPLLLQTSKIKRTIQRPTREY